MSIGNALSLATSDKDGFPSVRMVLLKEFNQNGFVFYTNLNSQKGNELKENPNAAMCFHWKSLLRQIRIGGTITQVEDSIADQYYNSRGYDSRIGAWASKQSKELKNRDELQLKFQEVINTLPQKQKLVFQMKYEQEMKFKDISEILGTSEGALKASYHIAVKKIKKEIIKIQTF